MYHTFLDGSIRLAIDSEGNYDVAAEKERTSDMFNKD
jgi:hypothetical protein